MQALLPPPFFCSFLVQQPELDLTPSNQRPSGGRPTEAKGLYEVDQASRRLQENIKANVKATLYWWIKLVSSYIILFIYKSVSA